MTSVSRTLFLIAGISLTVAAMLSAYGFHGLPGTVPDAKLQSWAWANQFQFFHSIALMIIALLIDRSPRSMLLRLAAGLMIIGQLLFCGSIYLETLGAPAVIGEVAPMGGTAFMLGWLLTGIAGWKIRA